MRIWIDVTTGTWGDASDLFFVEVEDGPESAMAVETLDNLSDSEICDWGVTYGKKM